MALWVVVGLMYLAMVIPDVRAWVQTVDDQVLTMAMNREMSPLVGIAEVLTTIGGTAVMLPFVVIVAGYLYWQKRKAAAQFWVWAMVVSEVLIWASKFAYARPRPPMAVVTTHGYSFPSGHAGTAATVAAAIVLLVALRGLRHWHFDALAVTYVVAMSWSRVYLRAHWLSDVFTGAALGAAVAISMFLVVALVAKRGRLPFGDDEAIAP
jgi:membrane-associated phospholipid phosphatase